MQACNTRALSGTKVARQGVFKQAVPVVKPSRVVQARAVEPERGFQAPSALAAAAAAAVLLASGPVNAAALLGSAPTSPAANPQVELAEGSSSVGGFFNKFWNKVPKLDVNEDPFGADSKQATTIGDTKNSIPIITEQEAVAPEAFPNPSEDRSPRPPVLAAAEGDEQRGASAGQYAGFDESGRQGLIDAKSPAQSSRP